jgi:hypothetical protein
MTAANATKIVGTESSALNEIATAGEETLS